MSRPTQQYGVHPGVLPKQGCCPLLPLLLTPSGFLSRVFSTVFFSPILRAGLSHLSPLAVTFLWIVQLWNLFFSANLICLKGLQLLQRWPIWLPGDLITDWRVWLSNLERPTPAMRMISFFPVANHGHKRPKNSCVRGYGRYRRRDRRPLHPPQILCVQNAIFPAPSGGSIGAWTTGGIEAMHQAVRGA